MISDRLEQQREDRNVHRYLHSNFYSSGYVQIKYIYRYLQLLQVFICKLDQLPSSMFQLSIVLNKIYQIKSILSIKSI